MIRIGIDLGTSYSGISLYDGRRAEVLDLESERSAKLLPSVVYYESRDEAIVGSTAVNAEMSHPERIVREIKRHMGKEWMTPPIHGVRYTPPQVSAEILKALKQEAEIYLAEPVTDVVITVPAHFPDPARKATEKAGELAELKVVGVVSEPHAAALVYVVEQGEKLEDEYLLVFDLGGGTLDVTLLRTPIHSSGERISLSLETVVKRGEWVGGGDWDRVLFDRVAGLAKREYQADLRADPMVEAEVLIGCEKAKRDLSSRSSVSIRTDTIAHIIEVTREEFEEASKVPLNQARFLLEAVIEEAGNKGVTPDRFSTILVGGSCHMPMIPRMIEEVTGKPPLSHGKVDLLVALGASYYAELADVDSGSPVIKSARGGTEKEARIEDVVDIVNRPIGVETLRDGVSWNVHLIPDGAQYGTQYSKQFALSEENMTSIPIVLWEGPEVENPQRHKDCEKLLQATITGIPTGRPAGARVEVVLQVDKSGILRGSAKDQETGKEIEIELKRESA